MAFLCLGVTTQYRLNGCKKAICVRTIHEIREIALAKFIPVELADVGCGNGLFHLLFEGGEVSELRSRHPKAAHAL